MVERFSAQGMRARSSTPEALAARVRRDYAAWQTVIQRTGLKLE